MLKTVLVFYCAGFLYGEVYAQQTNLSPTVHRWKRHCTPYGCGRSVCQDCPSCCGSQTFSPVLNINFNCCSAPRPSPSCCPYVPPVPSLPPPSNNCCGSPQQSLCCQSSAPSPCCKPPSLPAPSPVICCKNAPVPENPCCQAIAEVIPPSSASPACCAAAPVPANPCCQPAPKPVPCSCAAPRPVPCRCGVPTIASECPNCDFPPLRCSMMAPTECSMRRMRRDVHQQILQHLQSIY